jgi:hypothetical protein
MFSMTLKRGNPNWRFSMVPSPVLATEFERQVRRLDLTADMYVSSVALRSWCEQNKDRCYVPEWLLAEWQMSTDPGIFR